MKRQMQHAAAASAALAAAGQNNANQGIIDLNFPQHFQYMIKSILKANIRTPVLCNILKLKYCEIIDT